MLLRAGQKAGRVRARSWASTAAIIQQRGLSASSGGAFRFLSYPCVSYYCCTLELSRRAIAEFALLGDPCCDRHDDVHGSLMMICMLSSRDKFSINRRSKAMCRCKG